jgi:tetratricopeptide (TPR) repeat protein
MVLSWSEAHVGLHELLPEVYTPQLHGSLQAALVSAARRRNRLAYEIRGVNALLREIAAGHPVIVLQNLGLGWFPRWHYAVVVGYDLQQEIVVLHSGKEAGRYVPWSLFMRTWKRADAWGLLVLPPGCLPASADERSYLMAVLGLEQIEQWDCACRAYSAALEQWENSLGALMGLGNCRYALGDLTGAEKAFRRAVEMNPEAGSAYNNLAHVLAEQERYSEAIEMSSHAQALGGPNISLYRQTLREIRKSQAENP